MPFLQIENQIESATCRVIATILPAILIALTIVTFLADLVIAVVDAIQAANHDCRILLGKPTPIENNIVSCEQITRTCRECIAEFKARGISRRSAGRLLNTAEMNEILNRGVSVFG